MSKERAKLFTHGGSQAVRLPKAFRFDGKEVSIRRDGERVILEPLEHDPDAFWGRIDALAEANGTPQVFIRLAVLSGLGLGGPDLGVAP